MPMAKKVYATLIVCLTLSVLGVVLCKVDNTPRTDDAYVYADTINVVPEVSGWITELPVHDNQLVHKGDLLYRIDRRPYQNALNSAQAQLAILEEQIKLTQRSVNAQQYNADAVSAQEASARAQYIQAATTYSRKQALVSKGYVSKEELDQARTAMNSAEATRNAAHLQSRQANAAVSGVDALVAQREEVRAQIAEAQLNLEYSEVHASFDGRVASLRTTVGQHASPAQSVMTLIDTGKWYVMANFRETDLKNVRRGTPATVWLSGDTSKVFSGTVESVSYGVTPEDGGNISSGLPSVERSINWVHVSQRFPVRIAVPDPDPELFRVGASAIATVHRDNAPVGE